jgi:hypothetical protein
VSYKYFEHSDFTLEVPADWFNVPSSTFELVFVMPPFPEGSGANVSVSITKGINPTSIDEIAGKLKAMQQESYPNYQIYEEGMVAFPSRAGFGRYYTWENTDEQLVIAQSQLIFMAESCLEAAVLTATRPALLVEADIEALNRAFSHMAATFQFNDEVQ